MRFRCVSVAVVLLGCVAGCEPPPVPQWSVAEQLTNLDDETLRDKLAGELSQTFGTPLAPRKPGASDQELERLRFGARIYTQRCAQCHGASGDGNGIAAAYLKPRPRDYRRGVFKFTSTPYGKRPRREDLVRTVRLGIVGTSMPSFALLPPSELNAVVDYVIFLAQRGETEYLLAAYAEAEEEMGVSDVWDEVLASWAESSGEIVRPLTIMPTMTPETIELGRQAFLTEGCSKCHGPDGRGKSQDNVGTDTWGFPTNAADITAGMLHGGQRPIDIYRRISSGINGTPMPAFRDVFDPEGKDPETAKDPDTMWHLVHYVLHVANQRRSTLPPPPRTTSASSEASAAGDSTGDDAAESAPQEEDAE
jgi:mono/diheme cytochrome c family protein